MIISEVFLKLYMNCSFCYLSDLNFDYFPFSSFSSCFIDFLIFTKYRQVNSYVPQGFCSCLHIPLIYGSLKEPSYFLKVFTYEFYIN